MTAPGEDWLLSMTCAADGLDHLMTAEAMAAGQVARTGVYGALCGTQVLATSLMTPPGKRCRDCRATLTASTSRPSQQHSDLSWAGRVWRRAPASGEGPDRIATELPFPRVAVGARSAEGHGGIGRNTPDTPIPP
ncbi:MAG: hypothetical protein ACR2GH_03680 [Pseudonocardia sp.]